MKRFTISVGLGIILILSNAAWAAAPDSINFQGRLLDGSGNPVTTATNIAFRVYDGPSGGANLLWGPETHSVTPDAAGLYNVTLGSLVALPANLFASTPRYLGITAAADPEAAPRTLISSVAYSLRVKTVDSASGGNITSKVSIGPGHTNTGTNAFVAGENNAVRGNYSVVGGGGGATLADSNSALGDWSTVSGGIRNIAGNAYATVGGGIENDATGSLSTIGGGAFNFSSGSGGAIGGGQNHIASGNWSAIGGGYENWATDTGTTIAGGRNNRARGRYATVGGGGGAAFADSNSASGQWSTVSGGRSNAASNFQATIGGGWDNTASDASATVGGGQTNIASLFAATVGGGAGNTASGSEATVGGGSYNTASIFAATIGGGSENSATDTATTVAGGRNNRARGIYSTVGGGGGADPADSNSALGTWSTVSGGSKNISSGSFSTISGGYDHTASAPWTSISGGFSNIASQWGATIGGGNINTASQQFATVGGGARNVASNFNATVGGGVDDTASGSGSVVPGGLGNKAAGDYSFAAGLRAKAIHNGAFVWGDFTNADFASTGTNQFLIRAGGGVGIGTNVPYASLTMNGSIGYKSGTSPMLYMYESGTQNQTKRVIAHSPGFPSFGLLYNDSIDAMYFSGPSVGIGTSAPATNLAVAGEISADAGTAAAPSFTFSGDLNTGAFHPAADAVALSTGGLERMRVNSIGNVGIGTITPQNELDVEGSAAIGAAYSGATAAPVNGLLVEGNVGIGTSSPGFRLTVMQADSAPAGFNRQFSDGNLLIFQKNAFTVGSISLAVGVVSYNAFTGSHYGWTEEALERGELVSLTGGNRNSHDNPESEIIYGIKRSSIPNDPACLGSYLALSEPNQHYSSENPHLIMAVGNGDMWVVDEGQNIQPGDYLISSSTPGHAMRDDETKYPIGHVVARAAEGVDWSTVGEMTGGRKHQKISVLFGNFVRGDRRVTKTVEKQQQTIGELQAEVGDLKQLVEKLLSSDRRSIIQPASLEVGLEK